MFDAHAQKMLAYYSKLRMVKLRMVTMVTLPPAKELKIQVESWQNEIRTHDVLNCPTWLFNLE